MFDLSDTKDSPLWLVFWVIVMIAVYVPACIAGSRLPSETPAMDPNPTTLQRIRDQLVRMNDLDIMHVMSTGLAQLQARRQLHGPSTVPEATRDLEKGIDQINDQEEGEFEVIAADDYAEQELLLPESGGWSQ